MLIYEFLAKIEKEPWDHFRPRRRTRLFGVWAREDRRVGRCRIDID